MVKKTSSKSSDVDIDHRTDKIERAKFDQMSDPSPLLDLDYFTQPPLFSPNESLLLLSAMIVGGLTIFLSYLFTVYDQSLLQVFEIIEAIF